MNNSKKGNGLVEFFESRGTTSDLYSILFGTPPEFKKKALGGLEEAHRCRRKALPDIKEFLKTIKNSKSYKDVMGKYNINHPFMLRKIKNVLSPFGITKYMDAKEFLAQRNIDYIFNELKDIGHIKRLISLGHFKS